jgi:hypothetical protein
MVAMYNPPSVRVMTCAVPYPVERSQRQERRNPDGCSAGGGGAVSGVSIGFGAGRESRCATVSHLSRWAFISSYIERKSAKRCSPPPDRLSVGRKREEVVADGAVRFTGRRSTPPIWVRRCDISYASKKLIDNQGLFILQLFH